MSIPELYFDNRRFWINLGYFLYKLCYNIRSQLEIFLFITFPLGKKMEMNCKHSCN
uniref:Uncharacterized protein n=1 Tax=Meloidogyne enterolobii TaxID=390850 RepID=A0A6V7U1V9_MELEN|nr:unnamed protein product [Meloidogyne enterolobii]